jgi:hypothetical protein
MKLSKEQKDDLVETLNLPWSCVNLRCDGYVVTLAVRRFKGGIKYRVMTYVNGKFDSAWSSEKNAAPEVKFLRKSVRPYLTPTERREAEKVLGKRKVAKDPVYNGSLTLYLPDWATGKAAINHLTKVCDSIELLTVEAAREALAATAPAATDRDAGIYALEA